MSVTEVIIATVDLLTSWIIIINCMCDCIVCIPSKIIHIVYTRQWFMVSSLAMLSQGRSEASSKTPSKTPSESPCMGRHQQKGCNEGLYTSSRELWLPHYTVGFWKNSLYVRNFLLLMCTALCKIMIPSMHQVRAAQQFFATHNINWWRIPPESPDMNPIENLWHELKEFIRREVKPRSKDELIEGIELFWDSVDIHKCQRYIDHLKKVLPRAIEVGGEPTGYWNVLWAGPFPFTPTCTDLVI